MNELIRTSRENGYVVMRDVLDTARVRYVEAFLRQELKTVSDVFVRSDLEIDESMFEYKMKTLERHVISNGFEEEQPLSSEICSLEIGIFSNFSKGIRIHHCKLYLRQC